MSTRVGTPVQGELLAGRYRLDECLAEYPRTHRTLWRGTDEVLNRQVAIELRVPGGTGAGDFLTGAMSVSRIVHPAVIGVYDAVDEGERAYVVREWVRGSSLASRVRDAPMAPDRAAAVARAAAEGVAALHAAGMVHGNLNPNSVIVDPDDDGVTLTDLRPAEDGSARADVRAVGALLYASLTGRWPTEVPSTQPGLPDAVRADGRVCSPRQIRAGIPAYLDALTIDLLDPGLPPPSAEDLATELRRFDVDDPAIGLLDAIPVEEADERPRWTRYVVPAVGVAVVALLGWVAITTGFSSGRVGQYPSTQDPTRQNSSGPPRTFPVAGVQILDPGGDGTELDDAGLAADGDQATAWKTDVYTRPNFGNLPGKVGMGVRVDLGASEPVRRVSVDLGSAGSTLELRVGNGSADPSAYRTVATQENAGQVQTFEVPAGVTGRYWLLWITSLPPENGGYGLDVREIAFAS